MTSQPRRPETSCRLLLTKAATNISTHSNSNQFQNLKMHMHLSGLKKEKALFLIRYIICSLSTGYYNCGNIIMY